jgi:hypothetical protein
LDTISHFFTPGKWRVVLARQDHAPAGSGYRRLLDSGEISPTRPFIAALKAGTARWISVA